MNKITTIILAVLLLFPTTSIFTSCSDDPIDETEDNSGEFPEGIFPDVPKELLGKIQKIYSKASINPQKVTTVNQLAILTSICATREDDGPISVTKAQLNGENITLVTLGGTEDVEGQATTMKESQLAAFGKPNDYLTAVAQLFKNGTIPSDVPIIITGISLGGMIAQQIIGEKQILENHQIKAIITFGSPITMPLDRKGVKVIRFADEHDKVPELGESVLRSGMATIGQMNKTELTNKLNELDQTEKIVRTSKYTGMIETHALSYIEDPCWDSTDFLGDPQKENILELKEPMKFYPAPQLEKE